MRLLGGPSSARCRCAGTVAPCLVAQLARSCARLDVKFDHLSPSSLFSAAARILPSGALQRPTHPRSPTPNVLPKHPSHDMLPKTIWLLWLQGWDRAPWLVQEVVESWKINNPDWDIKLLSSSNLRDYVNDVPYIHDHNKRIPPQHQSDIIRLSLLKNYGGVWADATLLCMQPLDTWAEEAVRPAGIWMYHGHGGDMDCRRGVASWFIIVEQRSIIMEKWKEACDAYWRVRECADEYFFLDRLFQQLLDSDATFRKTWSATPYLYCETQQAHMLAGRKQRLMTSNNPGIKKILRERPPYALKLWWRPWEKAFPDPSGQACRNSNGSYAIEMSKRRYVFEHQMEETGSFAFYCKTLMRNMKCRAKRAEKYCRQILLGQRLVRMAREAVRGR